jgi:RNA polymerase sigma-70 factor (ECF subfamily)
MAIDAALAQLPEDFRAPVVLRDLCDLDYAEIAVALDIPPGTVRSRIARGRAQLARLLEAGNHPRDGDRPTSDAASPLPHPPHQAHEPGTQP